MTDASDSRKPTEPPEAGVRVRLPLLRSSRAPAPPGPPAPSLVPRGRTRKLDWRAVVDVLAERSGLHVALLDARGEICSLSEALQRDLGWALPDVERRLWVDVYVPAERREQGQTLFEQVLRGAVASGTCELASRDGTRYSARFLASVVGRGRRQGTMVIFEDITPVQRVAVVDQDLDYRIVADLADFGRLEKLGGTAFEGSAGSFRCFELVARRSAPCEDCPVRRGEGAWPRTVVRRRERGGFEVVSAKAPSSQSVELKRRVVSEATLAAIHGARIEALAVGAGLTERESEVLRYLMLGRAPEDIATILGLSPRTVKFHQRNVLQKVGADSRVDLMRLLGF